MKEFLLVKCAIQKENNNFWLHLNYDPSLPVTGDSYLIDYFSEEELLNKVYTNVKDQVHNWYINNK